jgi:stage V sporulation protein B
MTKTHAPYSFLTKVTVASLIMAIPSLLVPNNVYGLVVGIVVCPIIYVVMIILLKTLSHDDVVEFRRYANKLGPIAKYANKLLDIIDKRSSK